MRVLIRPRSRCDQQRGMALLLAIAMLLLLSVLGATVLDVASRSTRASGQIDTQSQAFSTADRIVSFGQHVVDMTIAQDVILTKGTTWDMDNPPFPMPLLPPPAVLDDVLNGMELGTITYVGTAELAVLLSSKKTPAKGNVYEIDAISNDGAPQPTRVRVENTYVKILSVIPEDTTFGEKDLKRLLSDASK